MRVERNRTMIMARAAVAALAACAAAFEHEQRVCPGDQPTNVSDTIFKERVVVFDEAMGARVVVAGDINKDGSRIRWSRWIAMRFRRTRSPLHYRPRRREVRWRR